MNALVLALCLTVPVAAVAFACACLLAPRAGHRPDRIWSAALLASLMPLPLCVATLLAAPHLAPLTEAWPLDMGAALAGPGVGETGGEARQAGTVRVIGWTGLIVLVWLAGAMGRAAIEISRSCTLRARLGQTRPAPKALTSAVRRQAELLGIAPPRCRVAPDAPAFAAGLVSPVLVMSERFQPGPAGRLVLAHELNHIRRRDVLTAALVRAAGAALWFNPLWFAIERRRRLGVEIACDSAALAQEDPGSARLYARALLDAVRSGSGWPLTAGFGVAPRKAIEMRLTRILKPAPDPDRPALGLGLAALCAIVLATASTQMVYASGHVMDQVEFTHSVLEGRTTSVYGPRDIDLDVPRFHGGHDIAAPAGTPVRAPAAGRVVHAEAGYGGHDSWGNVVVIDHGGGWQTVYAHLEGFEVESGERIAAGDPLGRVGSTGVTSGPHLHVEVRFEGERVDPVSVLPGLSDRG